MSDDTRKRSREPTAGDPRSTLGEGTSIEGFLGDDREDRQKPATGDDTAGVSGRIAERARRLFSPRAFLVALALTVGGLVAANALVPLPLSGLLGVFLGTFLLGVISAERRYLETAVAGGATVGASALADYLVVSVLGGIGLPLVAVGAVVGVAVAVVGTYFGRDLRDGLTREL